MTIISRIVIFLFGALVFSGCAMLSEENRYITRALDESFTPSTTTGKVLMAPVAMPIGITALAIDGFILHPLSEMPNALDDASMVFSEVPFTGPCEILVFPMRIVTFPVIFLGSQLFRSTMM